MDAAREKARQLIERSVHLAETGDRSGALEAIKRAVKIMAPFAAPGTHHAERFEIMKRNLARRETEFNQG